MVPHSIPNTSGIYRITCIATGKFYVGSSINLRKRWSEHRNGLLRKDHGNQKLQRAWDKYGEQHFTFEVIELVLSVFLLEREQYWLDTLKPFGDKGFNMAPTAGSALGRTLSPEAREKIRIAQLGRKHTPQARANMGRSHVGSKRNIATRAKMSQSLVGNTRNVGRKLSSEHIESIRLANIGREFSDEAKRKMSESRTGKKQSPETIERKRLANLGTKRSMEIRSKMSASGRIAKASKMKTLIAIAPDGTEYLVVGIRQFCKEHNLDRSTLMRVAKGEERQHKGWIARFPD